MIAFTCYGCQKQFSAFTGQNKKQKKTRHCVHTKENNNDFQNDSSITQLFFTAYNKYDFYL